MLWETVKMTFRMPAPEVVYRHPIPEIVGHLMDETIPGSFAKQIDVFPWKSIDSIGFYDNMLVQQVTYMRPENIADDISQAFIRGSIGLKNGINAPLNMDTFVKLLATNSPNIARVFLDKETLLRYTLFTLGEYENTKHRVILKASEVGLTTTQYSQLYKSRITLIEGVNQKIFLTRS